MKKVQLYGYRANDYEDMKHVATVFVQNHKVVVEGLTRKLERELLQAIEPAAYGQGLRIAATRESAGTLHTVDDPRFLEAFGYATGLWAHRYDGWKIRIMASKPIGFSWRRKQKTN